MQIQRTIIFPFIVIALVIAAIVGLGWANAHFLPPTLGQPDFALGWSASNAWLINGTSPYDGTVLQNAQQLLDTSSGSGLNKLDDPVYINPLYSLIFYGPFGLMDYGLSRVFWLTVVQICFLLLIIFSMKVSGWNIPLKGIAFVILLFFVWYNGARAALSGQFIIIPLLLMVGALWLVQNNQDVGAGFFLALSTVKPDISIMLVLYVSIWSLFTKRYRLFMSILASMGFLLVVSILLLPDWVLQWVRILVVTPGGKGLYQTALMLISQSLPGVKNPLNIMLHAAAVILLLWGWTRSLKNDKKLFLWTASLTLVISTVVGYRMNTGYGLALLPGLFLIFRVWQERWQMGGYISSWVIMVLILAASWFIPLFGISKQGIIEPVILVVLPPITILLGLYWIRWWAVKSPQLPFEVLRDRYGL